MLISQSSICILSVDQRSIHIFSPQWDSHRISELCSQSVLYEGVAEQYAEAAQGIRSFWEKPDCLAVTKLLRRRSFWWIAMGCYESFMILWLAGLMLLLLTERIVWERTSARTEGDLWHTGRGALAALVAVLLRSLMIVVVTKAFHLEYLRGEAVQRSVTEMLGWMLQPGAFGELAMILKRTFVLYGVFAYAYLPIRIFILSAAVILVVTLVRVIRGRDLWALLLLPAAYLAAFSLLFIEGKATLYRSAQFLPVFCGYGALLFVYGIWQLTGTLSPRKAKNRRQKNLCWCEGTCSSGAGGDPLEPVHGYDQMVLY